MEELFRELYPAGIVLFAIACWVGTYFHKRRRASAREAVMRKFAKDMGMEFDPHKNRSLAKKFSFIKHLNKGHSHYAINILRGRTHKKEPALMFDFHFTTGSGRDAKDHEYSVFTLRMPRRFPELQIEPEGFNSALKRVVGLGDINFESLEFSNRYEVRSSDKKFAYDFCHAKMIDYLMRNRDFTIELDRYNLVLISKYRLSPALCRANYHRLLEIRDLMPNYLFS